MAGLSLARLALIALAVTLVVAFLAVRSCAGERDAAAQARFETRASDAYGQAAADAVATVAEGAGAEADLDALAHLAAREIEHAPNDEAAHHASLHALCRLRLYRDRPECALLRTHPGPLAPGGGRGGNPAG